MAITTIKSAYWKGFRDGAPFLLVVGPFALLFGVLAIEAGLNVFETMAFSIVVIAGAAQFTALQLMDENAPTVIVLASALAVNLRMAMYSASLTPYIGAAPLWQRALAAYFTVDQSYACSVAQYEKEPDMTVPERMAYFAGAVSPVCPMWYVFTLVGALIGAQIPDGWALDFALPITFLALVTPMLRTPAHVIAALVAIVASLVTAGVPYSLGLILSGVAGMVAGAQAEVWLEARKGGQQ
ncbi:AzlC family ABC transporter permease [Sulfitobacter sabulilitoris]|uniref:AzlC family ABC transporter permease n=1 Tax=Sulfitobacter sabulilitoris TaxID=2562655 RepID=A0A5S3PM71_9RHOB|nr:AzlC family ABC transporter permease [Sulfitobacter sabulilitoris]TMM55508.1 AzlC family ABC transporter permease [Sulfitobacter sabulilitoris]